MADPLSDTLSALADPTRRAILARLSLGEATVGELAKPFAMSGPAVTKHLNVLEKAGLIRRRRDAQRLKEAAEYLVGFRQFFEGSLDRLEDYLQQLQKKDELDDPHH